MANRDIVLSRRALADLASIYNWIADQSGEARAEQFTDGLRRYCTGFGQFPERGTRRDDLHPGLRSIGYRNAATIAFTVTFDAVVILRILYRGRSLESALEDS